MEEPTKAIRVFESDYEWLSNRGSTGQTFADVVNELHEEHQQLKDRVEDEDAADAPLPN